MNILEFFNLTYLTESSEAVEIFLRNASFSTLFISMMFYWTQTAFSSMKKTSLPLLKALPSVGEAKSEEVELVATSLSSEASSIPSSASLTMVASKGVASCVAEPKVLRKKGGGSLSSLNFFVPKYLFRKSGVSKLANFGTITMILSNFLLMCLLIVRWRESGHFPLSNLYESLMFLSWSCTCIHLILDQIVKTSIVRLDATLLTKLIGSITSPSALFTNAFATFSLPPEMQKASPLVPALQSNWLMMHVTVMIISYSALILGSLLSIAFLILISAKGSSPAYVQKFPASLQPASSSFAISAAGLQNQEGSATPPYTLVPTFGKEREGALGLPVSQSTYNRNNRNLAKQILSEDQNQETDTAQKTKNDLAWNFDNLSYRVLGIGFPFLTIGILSGAVWANEAWGSYWSWDPKETWALLTWLIFAIYLHARITKGWQGKKPALIASFGFVAIWFCFLGVNLIGEGLHSYGWFSSLS